MKTGLWLATSLLKKLMLGFVRLGGFSLNGIRLVAILLLPLQLIENVRGWRPVIRYLKILAPARGPLAGLIRFYLAQADIRVWMMLIHDAWDTTLKYNDFSGVADLRAIAGRGQGLLVLGMHYGTVCGGYVLHRMGLNPAILAESQNIPDLDGLPLQGALSGDIVFRGTYDGMVAAKHSEKALVKMMISGRPGMILMDGFVKKNFRSAKCLGIDYPLGAFPFKLALTHAFPVAVLWFSKIKGQGYKLNVREIYFSTIEEGAAQYGALLDAVVRADPLRWQFAAPYTRLYYRAAGQVVNAKDQASRFPV